MSAGSQRERTALLVCRQLDRSRSSCCQWRVGEKSLRCGAALSSGKKEKQRRTRTYGCTNHTHGYISGVVPELFDKNILHDAVNPLSRCASHREVAATSKLGDKPNRGHQVVIDHPASQNNCQSMSCRCMLLAPLCFSVGCVILLILHWGIAYDAFSKLAVCCLSEMSVNYRCTYCKWYMDIRVSDFKDLFFALINFYHHQCCGKVT